MNSLPAWLPPVFGFASAFIFFVVLELWFIFRQRDKVYHSGFKHGFLEGGKAERMAVKRTPNQTGTFAGRTLNRSFGVACPRQTDPPRGTPASPPRPRSVRSDAPPLQPDPIRRR